MYRYLEILQTDLHIKCVSHSESGALADLCQLDNGGCEQVCYNLCNLKVQCDCWPGYTLAYDGKTCMGKYDLSVFVIHKHAYLAIAPPPIFLFCVIQQYENN